VSVYYTTESFYKTFIQFNALFYHFIILMLQLLHKYLQTRVFYNLYSTFFEHLESHNAFF